VWRSAASLWRANYSCPPTVGYEQFGEEIARKIGTGSLGSVTRHRENQLGDVVFRAIAEVQMEWIDGPREGLPFDIEDFMRRAQ